MKPKSTLRSFLLLAGSSLLAISCANATTLYWDVDGTVPGFSTVVGGWNGANAFWNSDSTGAALGSVTATTGSGDDLVIAQATTNTGSITVTGTPSASSITFAPNVGPTATITGGAITIGGTGASSGVFQASSGANTISTDLTLKSDVTALSFANSSSGLLTIGAITGAAPSGTQTINLGSSSTGGIALTGVVANGLAGGNVALGINSSGAGSVSLSGANTFTGGVTLTAGTLNINSAGVAATNGPLGNGGTFTISGGTIDNTSGSSKTLANVNPITLNASFAFSTAGGTSSNNLILPGAVTMNAPVTITGNGQTMLQFTGGLNNNGNLLTINQTGTPIIAGNFPGSGTSSITFTAGTLTGSGGITKNGTGVLNLQSQGGTSTVNITGPVTINDGIVRINSNTGTGTGSLTINGGLLELYAGAAFTRTLGNAAGQFQILGGASGFGTGVITLGGGTVQWGSSFFSPSTFVLLSAASNVNSAMSFANAIDLNGATRNIAVNGTIDGTSSAGATLSGIISTTSGTAGITKSGVGNLILGNASNSYNGATTITGGWITVGSSGALGSASNTLVFNGSGATLRANAAFTSAATRGVTMTSTGIIDTNTFAVTIAGDIAGAGGLTKNSTGTLTISGTNTYGGVTTVNAGTLAIPKEASLYNATPGSWTTANINVKNGATLALNVDSAGTAGFSVSNLNTLLGNISVAASASAGLQSGAILALDTSTSGGTYTQGNAITNSTGAFGGAISLTKLGIGTLILDKANTYTGQTIVNAGTLQLNDGGAISAAPLTLNGGILVVNRSGTTTMGTDIPALIGGVGGTLINTGSGTLVLNNPLAIQYTALDTTGAGTFSLSGVTTPTFGGLSGATGNLATVITSGYGSVTSLTLNPQTGSTFTYGGVIANGAAGMTLTKNGAGTQILQGANTYSGATTINAGTLTLSGAAGAIASTTINLNGGGLTLTNIDSTEGALNRIANGAGINSNGGTITYTNTSGASNNYAETIGTPVLTTGQLNLVLTNDQAGSQILTLGGLTRTGAANTSSVAFASGVGLNGTTNQIVVTGAAAGFIGPWATCGTSIAASFLSDYAVYNGSAQVVPANIAATPQNDPSWIAGANVTLSGTTILTATRTVNTLRFTGGTVNVDLGTNSLETYGFLSGGSGAPTITNGTLTTPSGGGNLYLALSRNLTVSAPINDNGGAVTVVQSGIGTLTLSSTTSNYSGGTVINNGGVLSVTANTNLGGASGGITLSGGQLTVASANLSAARIVTVNAGGGSIQVNKNNNFTTTGKLTGAGPLTLRNPGGSGTQPAYNFDSTSNDFTGQLLMASGTATRMNSFSDSANNIVINSTNTDATTFTYGSGAASALTLSSRAIEINAGANATTVTIQNSNTTNAVTIGTNLVATGAGAKTLTLDAAAGPTNLFSGNITNGIGGGNVAVSKTGAGTWTVSGTNSHSGGTSVTAGKLNINSATALGAGTFTWGAATIDNSSGSPITNANNNAIAWNGDGTFAASNDLNLGTGAVTLGGNRQVTITNAPGVLTLGGAVSGAFGITKGGGGSMTLTSTSSTYTGATNIGQATLNINSIADYNTSSSIGAPASGDIRLGSTTLTGTLNHTGAASNSNRTFQIGNGSGGSDTGGGRINANGSGALTLTAATFNTKVGTSTATRTLTLGGANAGEIQGVVQNYGTSTGKLNLAKDDGGTWTLKGINTYTGTTAVNAGKLFIDGDQTTANGAVSVAALATLGGTGTLGGTTTIADTGKLEFNLSTAPGSHDKLELAATKTLTFSASSTLTITSSGGASTGLYTLVTAPGAASITGSVPTVVLPGGWTADTPQIVADGPNTSLQINITSTGGGGPGPLDHFAISAIGSLQTVGTPITGITLTAQDAANQTVTSFTGTVNFGGTGGFTGTSGTFTAGVLSGVSVTPTVAGSGLTFTVTDIGSGKTGSATITTIQTQYQAWAGGALFDADANGDGVKNGLAFLLGAANPSASALSLLPIVTQSGGNLILNFNMLKPANRGSATLNVQHSRDLGIGDPWTTVLVTDGSSGPTSGVTFVVGSGGGTTNPVTATISSSEAGGTGKLFGRLKANP